MKRAIIAFAGMAAVLLAAGGGERAAAQTRTAETGRGPAAETGRTRGARADITIEKRLLYDQHTLADSYADKDGVRVFQFDKMRDWLFALDSITHAPARWGILQNRKNTHGRPPNVKNYTTDEYHSVADRYGVQGTQSAPLYAPGEFGSQPPERYGRDGSLVRLSGFNADSTAWRVESYNAPGQWEVPFKYVKPIAATRFDKAVMVDLTNQNIATLERDVVSGSGAGSGSAASGGSDGAGEKWLVRSMNPCTTGAHQPPHAYPTPAGMFVVQDRTPKMMYNNGGPVIVGFAPWASRFTNGAFLHGVPVNNPSGSIVEFSPTLGTIPRSHECVRNASSHAEFIYDWAPLERTIVFVYN